MSKNWIIGIGVLALVLGGLFFMGYIPLPGDKNASYMEIIVYDVDGNELGRTDTRLSIFGIQQEGVEGDIYSLKIVVYFTVTTDINYQRVATKCFLEVDVTPRAYGASSIHSIDEHLLGPANTDLEGSFYRATNNGHYLMEELFPAAKITESAKADGWVMTFDARLETDVIRQDGTMAEVEDTCSTHLILVWVEHLELESYFGFS